MNEWQLTSCLLSSMSVQRIARRICDCETHCCSPHLHIKSPIWQARVQLTIPLNTEGGERPPPPLHNDHNCSAAIAIWKEESNPIFSQFATRHTISMEDCAEQCLHIGNIKYDKLTWYLSVFFKTGNLTFVGRTL